MVKRLTQDQRGRVAEKFMEWGNLVFAGLVISQALSGSAFHPLLAVLGVGAFIVVYLVSIRFMKGGE